MLHNAASLHNAVVMSGALEWLDSFFLSLERDLTNIWNTLVLQERQHPVILALALFIVVCFFLSLLCNCCIWCCGLCRPRTRQPGLIFVPANYGTMIYPPPVNGQQKPPHMAQQEPVPSTSKQAVASAPYNV